MPPQPCQGIQVWWWNYVLGGDGREGKSEETRFVHIHYHGIFLMCPKSKILSSLGLGMSSATYSRRFFLRRKRARFRIWTSNPFSMGRPLQAILIIRYAFLVCAFILPLNGSKPFQLCPLTGLDHTPQGKAHGVLGAVPSSLPGQPENEIAKALRLSGFPEVEKPMVASQHATKVLGGIQKRIMKLQELSDKINTVNGEPNDLMRRRGAQHSGLVSMFHDFRMAGSI